MFAPEELEEVPIEAVHVGDVVLVEAAGHGTRTAARVLGLTTTRHRETNHVVGWLLSLEGRQRVWLRRHARLARRRARG